MSQNEWMTLTLSEFNETPRAIKYNDFAHAFVRQFLEENNERILDHCKDVTDGFPEWVKEEGSTPVLMSLLGAILANIIGNGFWNRPLSTQNRMIRDIAEIAMTHLINDNGKKDEPV